MTETPCPNCGEPVEQRQLVCLNCGGRVALHERVPLAREPMTAIAAVLVAVVVIGAVLFGFAISELTAEDENDQAAVTTREQRSVAPEAPAVVAGSKQETEKKASPKPKRGVPGWPKGLTAHTVVLVTSSDRAAALNVAKDARSKGLEAGMFPSDPYDLGTGLWIVYSGRFTSLEGAQAQASQLARSYPGAYAQLIQSSQ
jgi:DNA-directed RNA polymerase subunit RPC12/RpoP